MTFTLKKSDSPRIVNGWPVVIPTALEGGKIRKDEVLVDYEIVPQSETNDIIQTATAAGQGSDAAILRRSVRGVSGFVDESNSPIPFDDALMDMICEAANIRTAMTLAFYDVQAGRKATRKN
jgi:transcription antitermination factor NusG